MAEAERHFQQGESAYKDHIYKGALREFLLAYAISRLPEMLINVAAASESLGRPDEAMLFLSRYLQERPAAADREEVRAQISRLSGLPVQLVPDPVVPPRAPTARSVTPAAPRMPSSKWPPAGAIALFGGGAAMLIIGGALGGAALSAAKNLESSRRFDADLFQHGNRLDAAGITADVIGGTALLAGAAWGAAWLVRRRSGPAGPTDIVVTPAGLGLAMSGGF